MRTARRVKLVPPAKSVTLSNSKYAAIMKKRVCREDTRGRGKDRAQKCTIICGSVHVHGGTQNQKSTSLEYKIFCAIICESMHVHGGGYQYVLTMTSFKQLAKTREKRTLMALRVRAGVGARDRTWWDANKFCCICRLVRICAMCVCVLEPRIR